MSMDRYLGTMALALALALGAQRPAAAQEGQPWSLRDCISYALDHNLTVQQGVLTVRQDEIDVNTAEMSRLPGVSASASENLSFGRGLTADNTYDNTNTTSTGFSLGAEVPVFQGFRIRHDIALAHLNLAAATADLERIRDDIRVAVAQAYVQILYDEEILGVADDQVAIDSLQVSRLTEMVARGSASVAELAQQRSALAQSRYQRTQAENNLRLAVLTLTQLLELPSPDGFAVTRPAADALDLQLLPSPEDIYAEAASSRPGIAAEERRLEAAATRIDLARSYRLPSLSLSGGLGTNYYTSSNMAAASFGTQVKNNFSQYIGLSLSVPIFSRFSTRNGIRSAELSYAAQQIQLENARKSLYKEIQQAWYNSVAAASRYDSSREVVASAEESFSLVSAKYELGSATATEFNEAKHTLLNARSSLAQARYEYLYQSRLLSFYRGLPIDF